MVWKTGCESEFSENCQEKQKNFMASGLLVEDAIWEGKKSACSKRDKIDHGIRIDKNSKKNTLNLEKNFVVFCKKNLFHTPNLPGQR